MKYPAQQSTTVVKSLGYGARLSGLKPLTVWLPWWRSG